MQVQSRGLEDSLEKEMATLSSIIAWRIPWTEEPGGLQFMESQRVRQNWANNTLQKEKKKKIWKVHKNKRKMKITEPHLKAVMNILICFLPVFFFPLHWNMCLYGIWQDDCSVLIFLAGGKRLCQIPPFKTSYWKLVAEKRNRCCLSFSLFVCLIVAKSREA